MEMSGLKKGDFVLILSILFVVVLSFFLVFIIKKEGKTVVVKENNSIVYEGKISSEKTVSLKYNTIVIDKGQVYMKDATCKNKICVHHKKISAKGETIICLPNRVIVEIE